MPGQRLSQIRRRKKKTWEDMFNELMHASESDKTEFSAWRIILPNSLHNDREDRRASREHEHDMQDEMVQIMKVQSDMLRHLVEVQKRQLDARDQLQPMLYLLPLSPSSTSSSPRRPRMCGGGKSGIPCTQLQGRVYEPEGAHSHTFYCYCSAVVSKLSFLSQALNIWKVSQHSVQDFALSHGNKRRDVNEKPDIDDRLKLHAKTVTAEE
ncbi:uncharacterized protein LOC128840972 [Malaclemys terrapin pileata]|uniref:uncharacterized protein LOC128840972 n=1 Tax=Malaclemys terrapin pileata TaxID=2991368 RepID=UPI0023A82FE2|nr:uncharacterized protein LOC128840972 [Malaclemys terrapin pileata]